MFPEKENQRQPALYKIQAKNKWLIPSACLEEQA
jgi:hypothetical protein